MIDTGLAEGIGEPVAGILEGAGDGDGFAAAQDSSKEPCAASIVTLR